MFNRIHTFQIARPDQIWQQQPSSLSTRFTIPKDSQQGAILHLRAELSSGTKSFDQQQGMRVSLMEGDELYGNIVADGTSIDDDGTITLIYSNVQVNKEYVIRYDLYDKEIKANSRNRETKKGECPLPYITQQLLIMDKQLVSHRVANYINTKPPAATQWDLQKDGLQCDMDLLANNDTLLPSIFDSIFEFEALLYCPQTTYVYKQTDDQKIYQKIFEIEPLKNHSSITYWFELEVGLNMMVSPGLKVMLSQADRSHNNSIECLYDHSCVLATLTEKNILRMNVLLTSGKYKLSIIDHFSKEEESFFDRSFEKPISLRIQANNVIQNENRVNCPYMYMNEDFIQNKFVEGMHGQRFSFQDQIIMNVLNQSQSFELIPEKDSFLKVRSREAFGVNIEIILWENKKELARSSQVGTIEALGYKELKQGKRYRVEFKFHNSIIVMSDFYLCPHFNLDVTMMPKDQALSLSKISDDKNYKSESQLSAIFNNLEGPMKTSYVYLNHSHVFRQNLEDSSSEYEVVVSQLFHVGPSSMQIFVEIHYSPYYSFDLDLALFSKDVQNAHQHNNLDKKINWNLYVGQKSLYLQLEPGEYELVIISKNLQNFYTSSSVAYQLTLIYGPEVKRQQVMLPPTLNYLGLLNPEGQDFGQTVYYCEACIIEKSEFTVIEFELSPNISFEVNFDAIISSTDNALDIRLEEVSQAPTITAETIDEAFESETSKGKAVAGTRMTRRRRTAEQELTAEKIKVGSKYRVVISLKNTKFTNEKAYEFNLRIEIQERPKENSQKMLSAARIMPKSSEEIVRYKQKNEGERESNFMKISSQTLGFIDKDKLRPFVRKSDQVYQVKLQDLKKKNEIQSISFEIKDTEAMVYAAIFDYTMHANLGLKIYKVVEENLEQDQVVIEEDFSILSVPGKYFNYIPPVTLQKGKYHLSFEPQTAFEYENAVLLRFGLDVLIEREDTRKGYSMQFLESSIQLCGITGSSQFLSYGGLNSPAYLHPLQGPLSTMVYLPPIYESSQHLNFYLAADTPQLLTFYVEASSPFQVKLFQDLTNLKAHASSRDLNQGLDNFVKQRFITGREILQMRTFVKGSGIYRLEILSADSSDYNDDEIDMCSDKIQIRMSVTPMRESASLKDCEKGIEIGKEIGFGMASHGKLQYSSKGQVYDTSYMNTHVQSGEAPYMFYFQANYDQAIEGILGAVLYKYDKDTLQFTEIQSFQIQDSQTLLVTRIEDEGTYVLALESLTSTKNKFLNHSYPLKLPDPCLAISYTAYFSTLASLHHEQLSYLLPFSQSIESQLPQSLPSTSTAFDQIYSLAITTTKPIYHMSLPLPLTNSKKPEKHLFKLQSTSITAYLYKNTTQMLPPKDEYLSKSARSFDENVLFGVLTEQKEDYKIKIVLQDTNKDQTVKMRIAQQRLSDAIEGLRCKSEESLPVESMEVPFNQQVWEYEGTHQVSSEFLKKYGFKQDGKTIQDITLDINIKVPSNTQEYYFDIEIRHQFLTSEIEGALYLLGDKEEALLLGDTELVYTTTSETDPTHYVSAPTVKRLKLDNLREQLTPEQSLSDHYLLRLTFSRFMTSLASQIGSVEFCFPFDLSIRISKPEFDENEYEKETDPDENELIRVVWGFKERFDPQYKLEGRLEFKETLENEQDAMKSQANVYLVSLNETQGLIYNAQSIQVSKDDTSILIFEFAHALLKNGHCYRLALSNAFTVRDINKVSGMIFCTTTCEQCHPQGSRGCDEQSSLCTCFKGYIGDKCDTCDLGFIKEGNECVPQVKCRGLSPQGEEECSGHGLCYHDEISGQARCRCEKGFVDNGKQHHCGKCEDSLFTFPNCQQRFWMISPSQYKCMELASIMPRQLYVTEYQNQEGQALWSNIYRLDTGTNNDQSFKTYHFFKMPKESHGVLRLFFDTHNSGLKASVTIQDPKKHVLYKSPENNPFFSDSIFQILTSQPGLQPDDDYLLTFDITAPPSNDEESPCPLLEVLFILQPFSKIQSYLSCSQASDVKNPQIAPITYATASTQHRQNLTLPSSLLSDQESGAYYVYTQPISIKNEAVNHALTIMVKYSFEKVSRVQFVLKQGANVHATSQYSYLEDSQHHLLSYLEVDNLPVGDYTLELTIPKEQWLPNPKEGLQQCLELELMYEHVAYSSKTSTSSHAYSIVSVIPAEIDDDATRMFKVEVRFDRELVMEEIMPGMADHAAQIIRVCHLEEEGVQQNRVNPKEAWKKGDRSIEFQFDMSAAARRKEKRKVCYQLKCAAVKDIFVEDGKESSSEFYIEDSKIRTQYCINFGLNNTNQCNPNAMAKIGSDGHCECQKPYTGPNCESCLQDYQQLKDNFSHTVCSLDLSHCSKTFCNSHGTCIQSGQHLSCKCDKIYSGPRCEQCSQSADLAYPDCTTSMLSEQVFQPNQQSSQCLFASHPIDLNALEYTHTIQGLFHLADYYTLTRPLTFLRFRPPSQGLLKVFLQQPEDEDLIENASEIEDIEITIAVVEGGRRVLRNGENVVVQGEKMDYAMVRVEISEAEAGKEIRIEIRWLGQEDKGNCKAMYMEIEYQPQKDTPTEVICTNLSHLSSTLSPTIISPSTPFALPPLTTYTLSPTAPTFFYHHDLHLKSENQDQLLFGVHISLLQPFLDPIPLDFLLEVLSFDSDSNNSGDESPVDDEPKCKNLCLFGGQKTFNEMHQVFEIASGSRIRIWLYQLAHKQTPMMMFKECTRFQISIKATVMDSTPNMNIDQNLCTQSFSMPESLNSELYLGKSGNCAFHRAEKWLIGQGSKQQSIKFDLKDQRMMMRVVAKINKHFEVDLELISQGKKLVESGAKGYEDTIFTQLEKGSYEIKFLIASQAFQLQLPCASIEVEIAFAPLSQVKSPQPNELAQRQIELKQLLHNTKEGQLSTSYFFPQKIHTYNLNNEAHLKNFASFQELSQHQFKVPDVAGLGLIIDLKSDFLSQDVNFALYRTNNSTKPYLNQRIYNGNRLILKDLAAGDYSLHLYVHQCLSNFDQNKIFDVSFTLDSHFVYWSKDEPVEATMHYLILNVENQKKVKVPMEVMALEEYHCHSKLEHIPAEVIGEMQGTFMIPKSTIFTHKMKYSASENGGIRVIIDRSNVQIQLSNDLTGQNLAESYSINRNQQQLLTFNSIKADSTYTLTFIFDMDENFQEFEETLCESFFMHIKSFKSQDICQSNQVATSNQASLTTQPQIFTLSSGTLSLAIPLDQNDATIILYLDYTQSFSPPTISGVQSILSDFSHSNIAIFWINHISKQNTLSLATTCSQQVSLHYKLLKVHTDHQKFPPIRYISQQEIGSLTRYVESLPVSLDTLKYFNARNNLLISEYFQLSSNQNYIEFTVSNQSLVKMSFENAQITASIVKDEKTTTTLQTGQREINAKLETGKYRIVINSNKEREVFHATIMIAEANYINDEYMEGVKDKMQDCQDNKNFPLSLNRKNEDSKIKNEIVYEYPLLRLSGQVVNSQEVLDRYAFRVNYTSRFYMNLGMHTIFSNPYLRLQELGGSGISYYGKQEFNLNVLDAVVGPGDYILSIEQSEINSLNNFKTILNKPSTELCGLYSLKGKITPIERSQSNGIEQTKCPIKTAFPAKIYRSQSETKSGHEQFIKQDGTFFLSLQNLLIKGNHGSDSFQLDAPSFTPAILSLTIQQPRQSLMIVSVTNSKLIHSTETITSHYLMEVTYIYSINGEGENNEIRVYYEETEQQACQYYKLMMSYVSEEKISQSMNCETSQDDKQLGQQKIEYPLDLKEKQDQTIVKKVQIGNSDIDISVVFPYPQSFFSMSLVNTETQADVALQFPVLLLNADSKQPLLFRSLQKSIDNHSLHSYTLFISADVTLMSYIYNKTKIPLCLYYSFNQAAEVQQQQQSSELKVVSTYPSLSEKDLPIKIEEDEVTVTINFNKKATDAVRIEMDVQENGNGGEIIERLQPIRRISPDKTVTCTFKVGGYREKGDKSFNVIVYNSNQNQPIDIPKGYRLPIFQYYQSEHDSTKINSGITKKAAAICNCVHGICRKDQSTCYQCNPGWTGKVCDIPKKERKGINSNTQSQKMIRPTRNDDQIQQASSLISTINEPIEQPSRFSHEIYTPSYSAIDNQSKDNTYIIDSLLIIAKLTFIGLIGFIGYFMYQRQAQLRDYIPISIQDREDGVEDDLQRHHFNLDEETELTTMKKPEIPKHRILRDLSSSIPMNTQCLQSNQTHAEVTQSGNNQHDDEIEQLSNELHLYTSSQENLPISVQEQNENITSEIDNALKELENDDEFGQFI